MFTMLKNRNARNKVANHLSQGPGSAHSRRARLGKAEWLSEGYKNKELCMCVCKEALLWETYGIKVLKVWSAISFKLSPGQKMGDKAR